MQILPKSCLLFGVLVKATVYILVPTSFSTCRNSFMQPLETWLSGFGAYHPRFLVCHSQEISGCQDDVTTKIILQCFFFFFSSSLLLARAEHPGPSGFFLAPAIASVVLGIESPPPPHPHKHAARHHSPRPLGVPTAFLVALLSCLQIAFWRWSFPASGLLHVFCSHVHLLRCRTGVLNLQMATRCRSTPAVSVLLLTRNV